MDNRIKVVVADDNDVVRLMIVDSLKESHEIQVVGEAADGLTAVSVINNTHPDVVLLDLVMPKMDGIGVMEEINKNYDYTGKRPFFIIISAAGREEIISQALQTGASYFFMKPFDGDALIKRIRMICNEDDSQPGTNFQIRNEQPKEISIENQVINLLRKMGVPVKMVGYKYLKDAIEIALTDEESLMSVTKNIYPEIADRHDTSPGNVERNIRYVIEATWTRQEDPVSKDIIERVFHDASKKPTNSEYILLCSEWIKFKGDIE